MKDIKDNIEMKFAELTQLKQLYFHLLVCEKFEINNFFSVSQSSIDRSTIVKQIEGSKCSTLDELFTEFASALEFPDYFGEYK